MRLVPKTLRKISSVSIVTVKIYRMIGTQVYGWANRQVSRLIWYSTRRHSGESDSAFASLSALISKDSGGRPTGWSLNCNDDDDFVKLTSTDPPMSPCPSWTMNRAREKCWYSPQTFRYWRERASERARVDVSYSWRSSRREERGWERRKRKGISWCISRFRAPKWNEAGCVRAVSAIGLKESGIPEGFRASIVS